MYHLSFTPSEVSEAFKSSEASVGPRGLGSESVCVCVCLSLGVCTHIFVVGCFQTPSVTSNLPGSLGNSVTLFLNKRLQSLRKRLAPPAPPPLPPFSSDLSRKECPYQLQKSRLAQKIQTCNPHLSDSDWCRYKSGFFF